MRYPTWNFARLFAEGRIEITDIHGPQDVRRQRFKGVPSVAGLRPMAQLGHALARYAVQYWGR